MPVEFGLVTSVCSSMGALWLVPLSCVNALWFWSSLMLFALHRSGHRMGVVARFRKLGRLPVLNLLVNKIFSVPLGCSCHPKPSTQPFSCLSILWQLPGVILWKVDSSFNSYLQRFFLSCYSIPTEAIEDFTSAIQPFHFIPLMISSIHHFMTLA